MNSKQQTDIAIIGGGLVGASLAIALKDSGLHVSLIEAKPLQQLQEAGFDARSIALSAGSQRILDAINLWPHLTEKACPIDHIHVSDQGRFGATRIDKANFPLGYVSEIHHINQALQQKLDEQENITLYNPAKVTQLNSSTGEIEIISHDTALTLQAKVIVAADGGNSFCRQLLDLPVTEKDYKQHAIVANIGLNRPHAHKAFERFTQHGPIALLPMTNDRAALVWVVKPEAVDDLKQLSDEEFLHLLQKQFGYRLGRFSRCGQRASFPLKLQYMPTQVKDKVVFIGNAAHSLHPIAGQGFNLGLRDVALLAEYLVEQGLDESALQAYQQQRQSDQRQTIKFTNSLISVFTSIFPLIKLGRDAALIAIDTIPALKNQLARQAMGFNGQASKLASGIALGEST